MEPQEITKKKFSTVRFREGYDPEEVDSFLDEVKEAWEGERSATREKATHAKLNELASQVEHDTPVTVPKYLSDIPQIPPFIAEPVEEKPQISMESITRLLEVAERTADEAVQEAQTKADGILMDARVKAMAIQREAEAKLVQLQAEKEELEVKISDYRAFVSSALRSFGEQLNVNDEPTSGG